MRCLDYMVTIYTNILLCPVLFYCTTSRFVLRFWAQCPLRPSHSTPVQMTLNTSWTLPLVGGPNSPPKEMQYDIVQLISLKVRQDKGHTVRRNMVVRKIETGVHTCKKTRNSVTVILELGQNAHSPKWETHRWSPVFLFLIVGVLYY